LVQFRDVVLLIEREKGKRKRKRRESHIRKDEAKTEAKYR
jgi:hypothetical protein